jgi:hypothetical protein
MLSACSWASPAINNKWRGDGLAKFLWLLILVAVFLLTVYKPTSRVPAHNGDAPGLLAHKLHLSFSCALQNQLAA